MILIIIIFLILFLIYYFELGFLLDFFKPHSVSCYEEPEKLTTEQMVQRYEEYLKDKEGRRKLVFYYSIACFCIMVAKYINEKFFR